MTMMTDGILTDLAIQQAVDNGTIEINPFEPTQLNPASYDLRLGNEVVVYDDWVHSAAANRRRGDPEYWAIHGPPLDGRDFAPVDQEVDAKLAARVTRYAIDDGGFVLKPGVGYLMATAETVFTKQYVGVVDGKSSLGRLFVQVHCTAGYIDPNFRGNVTLEVTVKHPIRLYAGMRIAQIRFHTMHGEIGQLYSGNYAGETSRGAVASRAWKQFERDVDDKK